MGDQSRERLQQGFSPIGNPHQPCLYPNPTNKRGFNYHPLHSASHYIRILRLHKGRLYDPIQCSLISIPLESEKCCYQAFSYAWGDLHDLVPIQVDGFRFQVTRNLKSALQHLRKPDADMDLWVDAVCIDQDPSDSKEKSTQVTLMTEIYRSATQVLIWLGPASEDSDLIMHFFDEEGKKLYDGLDETFVDRTVLLDSQRTQPLDKRCEALRRRLFDPNESRLRRSLESLFRRGYWERVWVVQEIITAKSINILCGLSLVRYNHAMAILSEFHSELKNASASTHHGTAHENLLGKLLAKLADTPAKSLVEKLTKLRRTSEWNHSSSVQTARLRHHPTMMTPLNIARERLKSQEERDPNWLQEMLNGLRHFKSSNPKDKIFSLMGIINPIFQTGDHVVPISYDLSLLQISLHLFKFCASCDNTASLNIIAASQPTSDSSFPSWLPNFSKDNGMVAWPLLWIGYGNRTTMLPRITRNSTKDEAPNFSDSDKTLSVNARVVAKIIGVTGDEDDPLATDRVALLIRIRSALAVAQRMGSVEGRILNIFWRVLATDEETRSYCLPPSLESLDESLKAWETFQEKDYIRQFRRMSYGRRFATVTTEQPLPSLDYYQGFSMCPSACLEGDLICQIPRCEYLIVLRSDNVDGTFYRFIGPCYAPYLEFLVRFSERVTLPRPQLLKIR